MKLLIFLLFASLAIIADQAQSQGFNPDSTWIWNSFGWRQTVVNPHRVKLDSVNHHLGYLSYWIKNTKMNQREKEDRILGELFYLRLCIEGKDSLETPTYLKSLQVKPPKRFMASDTAGPISFRSLGRERIRNLEARIDTLEAKLGRAHIITWKFDDGLVRRTISFSSDTTSTWYIPGCRFVKDKNGKEWVVPIKH